MFQFWDFALSFEENIPGWYLSISDCLKSRQKLQIFWGHTLKAIAVAGWFVISPFLREIGSFQHSCLLQVLSSSFHCLDLASKKWWHHKECVWKDTPPTCLHGSQWHFQTCHMSAHSLRGTLCSVAQDKASLEQQFLTITHSYFHFLFTTFGWGRGQKLQKSWKLLFSRRRATESLTTSIWLW